MENTAYDEIVKLMDFLRQKQESITFERQHDDLLEECKESDQPQRFYRTGIGLIESERASAYAYWRAASDLLFYLYELKHSKKMLKLSPGKVVEDFFSKVDEVYQDTAGSGISLEATCYSLLLDATLNFLKENYPDIVN